MRTIMPLQLKASHICVHVLVCVPSPYMKMPTELINSFDNGIANTLPPGYFFFLTSLHNSFLYENCYARLVVRTRCLSISWALPRVRFHLFSFLLSLFSFFLVQLLFSRLFKFFLFLIVFFSFFPIFFNIQTTIP